MTQMFCNFFTKYEQNVDMKMSKNMNFGQKLIKIWACQTCQNKKKHPVCALANGLGLKFLLNLSQLKWFGQSQRRWKKFSVQCLCLWRSGFLAHTVVFDNYLQKVKASGKLHRLSFLWKCILCMFISCNFVLTMEMKIRWKSWIDNLKITFEVEQYNGVA
jgi:hypothetical protein